VVIVEAVTSDDGLALRVQAFAEVELTNVKVDGVVDEIPVSSSETCGVDGLKADELVGHHEGLGFADLLASELTRAEDELLALPGKPLEVEELQFVPRQKDLVSEEFEADFDEVLEVGSACGVEEEEAVPELVGLEAFGLEIALVAEDLSQTVEEKGGTGTSTVREVGSTSEDSLPLTADQTDVPAGSSGVLVLQLLVMVKGLQSEAVELKLHSALVQGFDALLGVLYQESSFGVTVHEEEGPPVSLHHCLRHQLGLFEVWLRNLQESFEVNLLATELRFLDRLLQLCDLVRICGDITFELGSILEDRSRSKRKEYVVGMGLTEARTEVTEHLIDHRFYALVSRISVPTCGFGVYQAAS